MTKAVRTGQFSRRLLGKKPLVETDFFPSSDLTTPCSYVCMYVYV